MILKATQKDINSLSKMANDEIHTANYQMEKIEEDLKKEVTLEI